MMNRLPDAERDMLRRARHVYVTVQGTDDVFYARISKAHATELLRTADGQLQVFMDHVDGGTNAYIDARSAR